jgi:hypothetical protein
MTRRERFMLRPRGGFDFGLFRYHLGMRDYAGQAKGGYLTGSCGESIARPQPPPEKCAANDRANPPNPPRVTSPEPDPADVPDDERFDVASPPKKLLRDHTPPQPPWPPPEYPRGAHAVLACGNDGPAIPAPFGSQFSPGISA